LSKFSHIAITCLTFITVAINSPAVGMNSSIDVLIDQAIQQSNKNNFAEAVISAKKAIATDPMLHRAWRLFEQITDHLSNADASASWAGLEQVYGSNPYYHVYHAIIFKGRGTLDSVTYEREMATAKELAPNNPFVLFYNIQDLVYLGQYTSALQSLQSYKATGGNKEVDSAVAFYECLLRGVDRQLNGRDIPLVSWTPPASFEIDISVSGISKPTGIQPWLIQLCGSNSNSIDFVIGGNSDTGVNPKRWKFVGGSQEDPYPYAPGLYIWDGSVIAVPNYGVIVVNGTRIKYVVTEGTTTRTRVGVVKDWRFVFGN